MVLIPASYTLSDSLSTELNLSIESLNPLVKTALCVCGGGGGGGVCVSVKRSLSQSTAAIYMNISTF